MVKMTDVAKRANVSVATISRVLNNKEDVSDETRKRIWEIIEEMNYIPNQVARTLYHKSSFTIGVMVPDLINPFYPEILEAIEETFQSQNYHVLLFNTGNNEEKEDWHIEAISSMMLDGLILISPALNTKKFDHLKIPIVSVDGIVNDTIQCVMSDYYNGAKLAVKKLIENGCKNVLHIAGPQNLSSAIKRYKGFNDEIVRYDNIKYKNLTTCISYHKSIKMVKKYIMENPEVDGIFAANDSLAFMVIKVLHELNIPIPQQIKLIGFDNNYMSSMITPELSTISQPIFDIGVKAAETLLGNIKGEELCNKNIVFDIEYIKRDTTIV